MRRSLTITVMGAMFLIDGVFLFLVSYGRGGIGVPLQYTVLPYMVGVTLLGSFRTGFKVALWQVLLLGTAYQFQRAGVIHATELPASRNSPVDLVVLITAVMGVTLATAAFGAVNERELRRQNYDQHALSDLAWRLESSLEPEMVADALETTLEQDFNLKRSVVVASDVGHLGYIGGAGTGPFPQDRSPDDDELIAIVMRERKTLLLRHLDPVMDPWLSSVLPESLNVLACPLYAGDTPIGVLVAEYSGRPGSRIQRRTITMVERCISYAALALSNAWLHERLRTAASSDPLTRLANRRTFEEALQREVSRATRTALHLGCLMIDIDHFKSFNDTYGHQMGDQVLKAVAGALSSACRSTDFLARYGGEEFVVLVPYEDTSILIEVAERMRLSVAQLNGHVPTAVTISVGAGIFPDQGASGETLVEVADRALYEAKENGRNRVVVSGTDRRARG